MTAEIYELWSKNMRITKFAKHLDKRQEYPSTTGIKITNAVKLQFYLEQMIDSAMFSKQAIIRWEKRYIARKTWPKERKFFENRSPGKKHMRIWSAAWRSNNQTSATAARSRGFCGEITRARVGIPFEKVRLPPEKPVSP